MAFADFGWRMDASKAMVAAGKTCWLARAGKLTLTAWAAW